VCIQPGIYCPPPAVNHRFFRSKQQNIMGYGSGFAANDSTAAVTAMWQV
jgi:hypothetical protein